MAEKKVMHNPVTGSDYEVLEGGNRKGDVKGLWNRFFTDPDMEDRIDPEMIEVEDFIEERIRISRISGASEDPRIQKYWEGYNKASQEILDFIREWNRPDEEEKDDNKMP